MNPFVRFIKIVVMLLAMTPFSLIAVVVGVLSSNEPNHTPKFSTVHLNSNVEKSTDTKKENPS